MSSESNDQLAPPELTSPIPRTSDIGKNHLKWSNEIIQDQIPTDILLITANNHEFAACYAQMENVQRSWCDNIGMVYFGQFIGNQNVKVTLTKGIPEWTSPIIVKNATEILSPKVALFVGICATIKPEEAKLGHVVIPIGLESHGNEYRSPIANVRKKMIKLIPCAADGWEPPLKDSHLQVKVHPKHTMLISPELVNNPEQRQELGTHFPKALGLEVKSTDLYKTASDLIIEWAVVKGVSEDLADRGEAWQPFSSAMAASLVRNMFKCADVIQDWLHYKDIDPRMVADDTRSRLAPPELISPPPSDFGKNHLGWEKIQSQIPTDILLITANDHEFAACYAQMENVQSSWRDKLGFVYFGQFIGNQNVKVALMKCAQGPIVASINVKNAAEILYPKVVLFVGICATMKPEKAKLGDVVISAKLASYAHKKVKPDGAVDYRDPIVPLSQNMGHLILQAADGWEPPLRDPRSLQIEVHRDRTMLSGPELVNNAERRQELGNHFPDALGLEMEGAGLYPAALDLGIEWAVIKGVSDFADGSKSGTEDWQPFSSAMAASVVRNMFKHAGVIKSWPHYKEKNPWFVNKSDFCVIG